MDFICIYVPPRSTYDICVGFYTNNSHNSFVRDYFLYPLEQSVFVTELLELVFVLNLNK